MAANRVPIFTLLALVGFITMSVSAMGIEVRDNAIIPRTEACGPPSSSCDACGAGYIPCGPSDCFNPSAGEICCNPMACPSGAVCGQTPGTCVFGSTTISLTTTTIVGTRTTTSTIVHDTASSSAAPYAPLPPPPSSIVDTAILTLPYLPNTSYAPTDVGQPIPLLSSIPSNVSCTSLTATTPVANVTIPALPTAATTSSLLENTTSTTVLTPVSTATLTSAVTPSASPTGGALKLHAAIGAWKLTVIAGLLLAAFITGV